jgi:hypothetical protein
VTQIGAPKELIVDGSRHDNRVSAGPTPGDPGGPPPASNFQNATSQPVLRASVDSSLSEPSTLNPAEETTKPSAGRLCHLNWAFSGGNGTLLEPL